MVTRSPEREKWSANSRAGQRGQQRNADMPALFPRRMGADRLIRKEVDMDAMFVA